MTSNPAKLIGKNPQPNPRPIRVFTPSELDKITGELDARGAAVVRFAAETGLRPEEWARVQRRDIHRTRRVLTVHGTKTQGSRREVPLTRKALAAIDSLPARLDSADVFAGPSVARWISPTSAGATGTTRSTPPVSPSRHDSTT